MPTPSSFLGTISGGINVRLHVIVKHFHSMRTVFSLFILIEAADSESSLDYVFTHAMQPLLR